MNRLAFLARHTTAYADHDRLTTRGIAGFFQGSPAPKLGEHLLLRLLPDGARIEQQDVCLSRVVGGLDRSCVSEHIEHLGRVVLVHLTAVGLDEYFSGHRYGEAGVLGRGFRVFRVHR